MNNYTREDLIDICERAVVSYRYWNNRDSYSAQVNVQEIYSYLKVGAEYDLRLENDIIWIGFKNVTKEQVENSWKYHLSIDSRDDYFEEFGYDSEMFDSCGNVIDNKRFKEVMIEIGEDDIDYIKIYDGRIGGYLPTKEKLDEVNGEDWY